MEHWTLVLFLALLIGCKKENTSGSNTGNTETSQKPPTPTGLTLIESKLQNNSFIVTIKWDSIKKPDMADYKVYRGNNKTSRNVIALVTHPKNTFTDTISLSEAKGLYYQVSVSNSNGKESEISTSLQVADPTSAFTHRNKIDLKSVKSLVLSNQQINLNSAGGLATGNLLSVDSNGKLGTLVIPDAQTYSVNINYIVPCTEKYLYLNGTLNVTYLNGRTQHYNNFLIDKETGYFYQLENNFGAIWSRGGGGQSPWVNGDIHYDKDGNIYINSESNSSTIQQIQKIGLQKVSDTSIRVTTSIINLIGNSYQFNFFVLKSGDIVYTYYGNDGEGKWRLRRPSGATLDLSNIIENEILSPEGKRFFYYIFSSSIYLINNSNGKAVFFIRGMDSPAMTPGAQPIFMAVELTINEDNSIKLTPVSKPYYSNDYKFNLFGSYGRGVWYYLRGYEHIFTNLEGNQSVNIWWKYNDNTNEFKVAYLPYGIANFATYSHLIVSSNNTVFIPLSNEMFFLNLKDFSYSKISNLGFEIFKTSYMGDEKIQFYGISFTNGKKVLGEISKGGALKILKELDDVIEIRDIVRIGSF